MTLEKSFNLLISDLLDGSSRNGMVMFYKDLPICGESCNLHEGALEGTRKICFNNLGAHHCVNILGKVLASALPANCCQACKLSFS